MGFINQQNPRNIATVIMCFVVPGSATQEKTESGDHQQISFEHQPTHIWNHQATMTRTGGIPTPLKNDGVRQLGWWRLLFPIYGKIGNVPNHQPDDFMLHVSFCQSYQVFQRSCNSDIGYYVTAGKLHREALKWGIPKSAWGLKRFQYQNNS